MSMIRQIRTNQQGLTLSELMVSVFLITTVGVIFSSILSSTLTATTDLEGAARSADDIRLVIERIDRELRGAETICEPSPGEASDTLEFITSTNPDATGGTRQIIYKLDDADADGVRDDLIRSQDDGLTWLTIADSVANDAMAAELGVPQLLFENQGYNEINSSGTPAASPSYGKVLSITLWIDRNTADRISPRVETTEIAGRNVWTPNAANCS